ncbi:hypothetical protein Dsin_022355 [Dipteronia sinensis]|uniref:Uncharacterized protein n=1 Tax=Dipteronia sinensis TaxID=43782 RepID=A0AAE0DZP6_9ROSI|nr:hypothetical protein Dsin_022355 [Dipteronia sinensis]
MVRGKVVFTEVPQNVVVSPASSDSSAFIGATSTTQSSGHIFSLGFLESEGQFRTSLQGTPENELQLCIESGDASVQTLQAHEAVFMNSGDNPFELFKDSIKNSFEVVKERKSSSVIGHSPM